MQGVLSSMRRIVLALLVLFAAASLEARPDRNAFLNRRADSIQDVVRQVQTDSSVRDRFVRHYAMSAPEVVAFLRTLRPARLQSDGLFEIYSVPPDGRIKGRLARLKKGTGVYVDPQGTPQLVALCANPLSRGPRKAEVLNPQADGLWSAPKEDLLALQEDPAEPVAEWTLADYTEPGLPEYSGELTTNTPDTVILPEVPAPGGGPTVVPLGTGGPGLGWLPGLGIPPLLGGGGGKGGTSFPPEAVPEPATLVLAFGAFAAALLRRRRS